MSLKSECIRSLLHGYWALMINPFAFMISWLIILLATLKIPYLLSLAGLVTDFLPAFPFVGSPTIRLVDKLDQAFAILLTQDRSKMTSTAGNGNPYHVSITDRVRIRSVVDRTRIIAVDAAAKRSASANIQDGSESFTQTDYENFTRTEQSRQARDSLNMSISKMYQQSLSILGDSLG